MRYLSFFGLFALLMSPVSQADKGFFYVTPQLTYTKISLEDYLFDEDFDRTNNALGVQVTTGYQAPFWAVVEVGFGYAENIEALGSTLDNYEIGEYRYAAGLAIPIGEHVRLVPKVGRVRYRLTAAEGQFLNPGSEGEEVMEHNDSYKQLDLEIKPNHWWVAMEISYFTSDTQFGDIEALRIGAQFEL